MLCVGNMICSHAEHEIEREVLRISDMLVLQLLPALGHGC